MRVGFLFNHDQVHQIAHSLPIALALSQAGVDLEIIVATTNSRLTAEVVRLGGSAIGRSIRLVELGLKSRAAIRVAHALETMLPATKLLIYGDNLDFFRSLDALVVAEKTSLVLKTRHGLADLKIIHTRHGAGDRAIGFDKASALFDHVLVSGSKIRERLIRETGLAEDRITVVGYPKFDLIDPRPAVHPMCNDGRPIVLYNPHVSPHLSSWYRWGRQILDWFVAHDDYHLIFAPHVMLFERPFVLTVDRLRISRPGHIDERYLRAPNIHIDLGSRLSTTMTYTNRADIYLGDVSSQVYEFLLRPRPCLFLDAQGTGSEDDPNFLHWRAGPVVKELARFGEKLELARTEHAARYEPIQRQLFDHSFDLSAEPSSHRAARAVAALLGRAAVFPDTTPGQRAYA